MDRQKYGHHSADRPQVSRRTVVQGVAAAAAMGTVGLRAPLPALAADADDATGRLCVRPSF